MGLKYKVLPSNKICELRKKLYERPLADFYDNDEKDDDDRQAASELRGVIIFF